MKARALPGKRLDRDRPAAGLDEPLRDRQAEARAGPRLAGRRPSAVERLEDPLAFRGADPRPLVDDADDDAAPAALRTHRHRQPARVASRVLEQVRERALELRGVGLDRGDVGIDRQADIDAAFEALARGEHHVLERDPVKPGLGAASLELGQVEELLDQRREALAFLDDGRAELAAILVGQRRRAERVTRRDDRGQRRAQVVRHRAQQRGLDVVGAAQRGGLDRLVLHRVAAPGDRDERAERRHDLGHQQLRRLVRQPARHQQCCDLHAVAIAQRQRAAALVAVGDAKLDRRGAELERFGDPSRRHPQARWRCPSQPTARAPAPQRDRPRLAGARPRAPGCALAPRSRSRPARRS